MSWSCITAGCSRQINTAKIATLNAVAELTAWHLQTTILINCVRTWFLTWSCLFILLWTVTGYTCCTRSPSWPCNEYDHQDDRIFFSFLYFYFQYFSAFILSRRDTFYYFCRMAFSCRLCIYYNYYFFRRTNISGCNEVQHVIL